MAETFSAILKVSNKWNFLRTRSNAGTVLEGNHANNLQGAIMSQHEINILTNVIEKAHAINSTRLAQWAEQGIEALKNEVGLECSQEAVTIAPAVEPSGAQLLAASIGENLASTIDKITQHDSGGETILLVNFGTDLVRLPTADEVRAYNNLHSASFPLPAVTDLNPPADDDAEIDAALFHFDGEALSYNGREATSREVEAWKELQAKAAASLSEPLAATDEAGNAQNFTTDVNDTGVDFAAGDPATFSNPIEAPEPSGVIVLDPAQLPNATEGEIETAIDALEELLKPDEMETASRATSADGPASDLGTDEAASRASPSSL